MTYTLHTFSHVDASLLLQRLEGEAVHLSGDVHGLHQPQAARLPTERGSVPAAEERAGPTDHGEIRDQHQPAGER